MPGIDVHGNDEQKPEVNCRTCTDFKSWAKIQRNKIGGPSPTDTVNYNEYYVPYIPYKFDLIFFRVQNSMKNHQQHH